MDTDGEYMNPMDLLSTELGPNTDDPLLTYPIIDDDDNDVEEIITEPEIISIDDESDPPIAQNGVNHESENIAITIGPGQLPDDYSDEERAMHITLFGPAQQAVQFLRLHCTACNKHLGSAPNKQESRYIHPLLKVLICKSCFEFYGSGDFDKDEDGTEVYCRWCGQGGKVLCCAKCAYVFCQRCIRVNLGKKSLEMVKASDDWLCFVCNPNQIMKLRVISRALYEYILAEIKKSEETNQIQLVNIDYSMCCKTRVTKVTPKRKEADQTYSPYDPDSRKKKKIKTVSMNENVNTINTMDTWNDAMEDEVVCTPDLSLLMDNEGSPSLQPLHTISQLDSATQELSHPEVTSLNDNDIQFVSQTQVSYPTLHNSLTSAPLSKRQTIAPAKSNKKQTRNKSATKAVSSKRVTVKINQAFTSLIPGMRYDWLNKAIDLALKVNQDFGTKLTSFSEEQMNIQSLEGLAQIHNDLQEVFCNSMASIMDIQKCLRTDFISGLKKLKFTMPQDTVAPEESDDTVPLEELNDKDNDNNDIIVLDSVPNDFIIETNETTQETAHGYLKLKPVSELLAPVITIPDDNVTLSPSIETSLSIEENTTESPPPSTPPSSKKAVPENIVDENVAVNVGISDEQLKKMSSVKVVLATNYSKLTLHSHPFKDYCPMNIPNSKQKEIEKESNDVECLEPSKQCSDDVVLVELEDPLALDYSSMNDDGNLNNGLTNLHESMIVA